MWGPQGRYPELWVSKHVELLALVVLQPSPQHGTTQQESYLKQFQGCPGDLVGAGSAAGA